MAQSTHMVGLHNYYNNTSILIIMEIYAAYIHKLNNEIVIQQN